MSLIKCPECDKKISDCAPACIECGYPLRKTKRKTVDDRVARSRAGILTLLDLEGGSRRGVKERRPEMLAAAAAGVVIPAIVTYLTFKAIENFWDSLFGDEDEDDGGDSPDDGGDPPDAGVPEPAGVPDSPPRPRFSDFEAELASQGRYLPAYVTKEFDKYLKCGRLEHGFLRVRCESCHDEKLVAFSCKKRGFCPSCGARRMADSAALLVDEVLPYQPMRQWVLSVPFPLRFLFARNAKVMTGVLGIVYRTIATYLAHKAGYAKTLALTGAVTLIQRFGSTLNLNIHFHILFLDGVYVDALHGDNPRFRRANAPSNDELTRLTHTIAHRVCRYLERQGLLERDTGNIYLTPEAMEALDEDPSNQLLGSSITYRIAVGPQQGRKVMTLQTLPDCGDDQFTSGVGNVAGFSLHAGVAARAHERNKLEHLCRYIARPAVSTKRLSMTRNGRVRYELKTPWRNGTTHVIFEPLD